MPDCPRTRVGGPTSVISYVPLSVAGPEMSLCGKGFLVVDMSPTDFVAQQV